MSIRLDDSTPFDLEATLCCGQAFRWEKHSEWWYGVVRDRVFKIRQNNDRLLFENVDADFVKTYFRLDDDLLTVHSRIDKDEHIRKAINTLKGLRILRQDPWECLISYICATYKSIAAIKRMLFNLSRKFGERVCFDGVDFYIFPTPERLATAHSVDLIKCGLGYRTKYVHETARIVNRKGLEFERLKNADYKEARAELVRFPGVELKVADCILLFSLEKLEAFPVDVWIKRAIIKHYASHFQEAFISRTMSKRSLTSKEYERLNTFGREYFGEYAGYAQEYLYHYERTQF